MLNAQELKTEVLKKSEIKAPPQAARNNTPSPQPELKPQPQVAAVATQAPAAAETPSPLTRKEDANPGEKDKMEAKALTPKAIATPGGEEGRKTLAGKTEDPKQAAPTTPNTTNPGLQPPSTKPADLKKQQ